VRRPARPRRPSTGPPRARADGTAAGGDQQIMLRRGIALGVGVLFLIVVVLAIHGCLDSRHKAALRDYSTKVNAIISENNTKAMVPLFGALTSGSSPTQRLQSLQAIDQEALSDSKQAHSLSAPSEMSQAQTNLELVLDLRSAAVNTITGQITTALSNGGAAQSAINRITGQMQALLASDVVYSQRVKPQIEQALNDASAGGQIPIPSTSLTNFGWLDNAQVTEAIGATVPVKRPGGKPAPGTHGHGLTDVKVNGVTLSTSGNNNVPRKPAPIFIVDFMNQGENDEVDVRVNVTLSGQGFKTIHLHKNLPQTKADSSAQATIPLDQPVPTSPALVTVSVSKVPGEKTLSNNRASYTVTFGPS
jgi:hypothetical protein